MAGMTMHKTRKKEQRRAILEAARQLLVANGYEQFSMRRLACRIGCSPTAIYHYFKDKGDIVRCLCEEVFERYLTGLENLIRPQDDPVACLRRVFLYWVCFGVENPDHYRLVFFTCPSIYGSPEEFLSHESLARRCYFSLRRMVRDCVAAGCFRSVDPDLAARRSGPRRTAWFPPLFSPGIFPCGRRKLWPGP